MGNFFFQLGDVLTLGRFTLQLSISGKVLYWDRVDCPISTVELSTVCDWEDGEFSRLSIQEGNKHNLFFKNGVIKLTEN